MALSISEIQANIVALEGALARGERDVTFADRRVVYNSADDLKARIVYFKQLLAEMLGGRSRQTFGVSEKGF